MQKVEQHHGKQQPTIHFFRLFQIILQHRRLRRQHLIGEGLDHEVPPSISSGTPHRTILHQRRKRVANRDGSTIVHALGAECHVEQEELNGDEIGHERESSDAHGLGVEDVDAIGEHHDSDGDGKLLHCRWGEHVVVFDYFFGIGVILGFGEDGGFQGRGFCGDCCSLFFFLLVAIRIVFLFFFGVTVGIVLLAFVFVIARLLVTVVFFRFILRIR
mmetsp:Transcript_6863/g.12873  ORF Transcript_6863/g.12873 Transcript_6863/m.12873 type:complete len:216 (-) Transcript_6863:282-929(-)